MKSVVFSVMAEEDLESIADYISRDSPVRALNFVQELRKQCLDLSLLPKSYRKFPELGENVYIMPYKNYVVLYQLLENVVLIERIIHGARDIMNLLNND